MNPMQHPERPLTPTEPTEIQPDEADLRQAREELAERVSAGKRVGKIDIEAALEAEMDADSRVFLGDLTMLLAEMCIHNGSYRCVAYVERIAARHIAQRTDPQTLIREIGRSER